MRDIMRTKWAAVGAAVAVTLGAGGLSFTQAAEPTNGGPVYVALAQPCRVVDTRPAPDNVGIAPGKISAGETNAITVTITGDNGNCTGIPTEAVGVAINLTAINNSTRSHFRVYPASASLPLTANLNFGPGQTPLANKVDVGLSAGKIKLYNHAGTVDAAIDIFGYYINHNHDDRYYQKSETYSKTEVDTAVNGKDNVEADIDGGNDAIAIGTGDQVVATVTVQTPTSGYVIVNSGGFGFNGNGNNARCSITSGSVIDEDALQINTMDSGAYRQFGSTRGFQVNKALLLDPATRTYNLVCDATAGSWTLVDPYLTATFVPDGDAFGFIILPLSEENASIAGENG